MGKLLTLLVGAIFGILGGAFAGHMMVDVTSGRIERAVAGAVAGGLCGLIGGSIGGDLGKDVDKTGTRNFQAILAGACAGAFGGAQSEGLASFFSSLVRTISV